MRSFESDLIPQSPSNVLLVLVLGNIVPLVKPTPRRSKHYWVLINEASARLSTQIGISTGKCWCG